MIKTWNDYWNPSVKTIASCFTIQAVGIGIYIAFGVFFNPLMETFGWTRATISGASSLAFFISGIFAIYVGRIFDRIGPRAIMTTTALFFSLGLVLMAFINEVWQLYLVFGVLFGIGLSSVDVIALSTIARWFPRKRGSITGIVKVGTGAGQFFFPFLGSLLIVSFGWRSAYLILGAIALTVLVFIARQLKRDPEEAAPLPAETDVLKPDLTSTGAGGQGFQSGNTAQLWLLCIANFTVVSCLMSTLVHIVPFARDIGISAHKAAGVLSAIGAVSMIGRFTTGMIIDRIGSKRSMLMAIMILILAFSWLQTADSLWKLYCFAGIYGLAHGSVFTVISPLVADLFGTRSHGSLFGLVVFSGTSGGAAGPFLAGFLFDSGGNYALPFLLMLCGSVLGLILMFRLKPTAVSVNTPV